MSWQHQKKINYNFLPLTVLFRSGFHAGQKANASLPDNDSYYLGLRYDSTILLNLTKNIQMFQSLQYVFEITRVYKRLQNYKSHIMYITTNEWIGPCISQLGKRFFVDYHTDFWLPGILSNWKRNLYAAEILENKNTKITKLPDVVVLLDRDSKNNIKNELYGLDCILFALCNSNVRPYEVSHPIISNDKSIFSLYFWTLLITNLLLHTGIMSAFLPKRRKDLLKKQHD